MLPDEQEVQDMKLRIGLMEKDVHQTNVLCERLSNSIEKIQELSQNLFQMIKLQEQKHEQHDKSESEIKGDIKDLHDRIDQVERHISQRIDDLRSDLMSHKQKDKNMIGEVASQIERWKWMIFGAVLALGFLLGKLEIGALLSMLN
jgi:chromosome segregation ATPase